MHVFYTKHTNTIKYCSCFFFLCFQYYSSLIHKEGCNSILFIAMSAVGWSAGTFAAITIFFVALGSGRSQTPRHPNNSRMCVCVFLWLQKARKQVGNICIYNIIRVCLCAWCVWSLLCYVNIEMHIYFSCESCIRLRVVHTQILYSIYIVYILHTCTVSSLLNLRCVAAHAYLSTVSWTFRMPVGR